MARHHRRYRRDAHAHKTAAHRSSGGRPTALKKYGPWAIGAGILAAIFWPRSASAATNEPAGTKAKVNVAEGLRVRSAPNLTASIVGTLANGVQVTVLQEHITPTDNSGGEWWQIDGGGMSGFSRAVDPAGVHNFTT